MKQAASVRLGAALVILFSMALVPAAEAETAYVTDQLRLGFHRAADTSDRPFRMLLSGEQVEILERNRFYARVRASDGTEGWVKAGFLMSDKPAVLRVAEVEAKQAGLDEELTKIAEERAATGEQIAALEQNVKAAQGELQSVRAENGRLKEENEAFQRKFATPSVPWTWTLGGALFALLAGFIFGLMFVDYRSRKRHGGIRVY